MNARIAIGLALAGLVGAFPAVAEQVLYLDASNPGFDPNTTWEDQTSKGNDFANMGAEWDPLGEAYLFGGPSNGVNMPPFEGPQDAYFELIGDDSDFDFETEGFSFPTPGDPFSVVAWINMGTDPGDDFVNILIQKGPSRDQEWKIRPRSISNNTEIIFNETCSGCSMYARDPTTPEGWFLLTITHNGSGFATTNLPSDTEFYFNDTKVTQSNLDIVADGFGLVDPIESDAPVRIGTGFDASGNRFYEGKIGFIEIWNEVVTASYVSNRYNNGSPTRVTPPPPTIVAHDTQQVAGVSILCFASESNDVYTLEHGPAIDDLGGFTNFNYTVTGSGTNRYVFDREATPGTERFYLIRN